VTGTFVFQPVADGVVEYQYSFNGGPRQTVVAAADGTAAIEWTPAAFDDEYLFTNLLVRSRSANGLLSDDRRYGFYVDGKRPLVTVGYATFGQPVSVTFTAVQPGAVAFFYQFDSGDQLSVPVGTDATATISWSPTQPGYHTLRVRTCDSAGVCSGFATRQFPVF
jgi:hypothetical protein